MKAHMFDVDDAIVHGTDKAILLYDLKYWVELNKSRGVNEHDGHTWTYDPANSIAVRHPYWTPKKVWRLLYELVEDGVLITGNYNATAYDRTKWYAFPNEQEIFRNDPIDFPKMENGMSKNGKPIPNTIPNRNTNIPLSVSKQNGHTAEVIEATKNVITYLNVKAGRSYSTTGAGNRAKVKTLLSRGYTVKDMRKAIAVKCMQWHDDAKMQDYMRPSTLLRPSHIDDYIGDWELEIHGE